MANIGIYGGTFDPVHNGHLTIAKYFTERVKLDKCYFVPAFQSPFKISPRKIQSATISERLKMLEIALKDSKLFAIDTFELDNSEISYTYKTIEYFSKKFPADNLFLLIGSDQADNFHKWRNWEQICLSACIVIASRDNPNHAQYDFMVFSENCKTIFLENPIINISSSEIRKRISHNLNCEEFLPHCVLEYISNNKIYQK